MKPNSAVSRNRFTCLRMLRKRRSAFSVSFMVPPVSGRSFFERDEGAAGAARVVRLGEARGAPPLGRPETGGRSFDQQQGRLLEQRAHIPRQALLVRRHLLGQLAQQVLVDAAQVLEQLAHLAEKPRNAGRLV